MLLSFLKLGSGTPEDFNDSANHERLIRELENTANGISDEVFHYWSQNEELSVELKVMSRRRSRASSRPGPNFPMSESTIAATACSGSVR